MNFRARYAPIEWQGPAEHVDSLELGDRVIRWLYSPWVRSCDRCDEPVIVDQPDPCLGTLPGVFAACCGHGDPKREPYILFVNGLRIGGFTRITPCREGGAFDQWRRRHGG